MANIKPHYLNKGDKVGIVAPAGKVEPPNVGYAMKVIASWGLQIVEGENLFNNHGYFSGSDAERLNDLQQMMDDPDVKAIFCIRGGYGVTRIIDAVNLEGFIKNPKWIIGFSDITALHLKLSGNNIESVHGIMPYLFDPEKSVTSVEHLHDFLFGKIEKIKWEQSDANISGTASGYLRGGNLSILADSSGTPTSLHAEDCILFLEEVDEYLYKIDRMLVNLQRSGKLNKIKALLIGHFTAIKDTKVPFGKTLEEVVLEKVRHLNIPVAFGLPSGHDFPNLALPHNRFVQLDVNSTESILTL